MELMENTVINHVGYVAIPMDEYAELMECSIKLDILVSVLYDNASLSWDKKYMKFDSSAIDAVLKAINYKYNYVINQLKEAEDETDNG